jgi:hypothetical protein
MPILMGAVSQQCSVVHFAILTSVQAFDDPLIYDVASVVGKEARAFGNYEQSGLDFWTPNINVSQTPILRTHIDIFTDIP